MLHNEEVCSSTIYSSSEASGVNHIIHRSRKPEAEVNNDLFMFSTRAQPELKTCCYFVLMSFVTISVSK